MSIQPGVPGDVSLAAVTSGALLLFSGRVWLASDGGTLVPSAGATLDGRILPTIGSYAIERGRWSNLALRDDGATERLFVNGREVAGSARGRVENPSTPLWIAGRRQEIDALGMVRPASAQAGWRAIVQHAVDALFLSASTARLHHDGATDTLRIIAVLLAAGWFSFAVASRRAPQSAIAGARGGSRSSSSPSAPSPTRSRSRQEPCSGRCWWRSGLALTAGSRAERGIYWLAAAPFAGFTLASLVDLGGVGDQLLMYHGSAARSRRWACCSSWRDSPPRR
jgi:hypothetical protein